MPIAKVTVGKSAYGCLNYVLTKDKAELLDTNCAGDTPVVLAHEFEVAFQPHYRNRAARHTENYVAHFSIAFPHEVAPPQLRAIAHRFMGLMGFDPVMNQFVLAQHKDTDDCHMHLVENRIRLDGTVVSDSFQQRRTEVAMRTIEEEFDLPRLKNSWEVDVRAPKVAEVRQSRESGKPIPRRVLQETIERCVVGSRTLVELQTKLQESNVTLNATLRDDGSWALLYQLALEDGKQRTFSATKLGKRYTKRRLQSTFGVSFGDEGVATEAVEPVVTVVPLVVPDPPVERVTGLVTGLPDANSDTEGFWLEPGSVSDPLAGFGQELLAAETEHEGFGQELVATETTGEGFWVEPGSVSASGESFRQEPLEAAAAQVESWQQIPLESTVETDGEGQAFLEAAVPETAGEGFRQERLEPPTTVDGGAAETAVTPEPALSPTDEPEGFRPKLNGSNAEPEDFRQEPGNVSEPSASFRQKLPELLATPASRADSFRQQLEQLAAQLAATPVNQWTDDLTPTQTETQTANLQAVLQWTQSHIETLELRAIWFGLQNANDQARWDALSAQAQQRGLSDLQQIEYAVTALACQQGYKNKAIVKLLQQSPRVQAAIAQYGLQTVETALIQNVVRVRQSLRQRQEEALKAAKQQKAK